MTPEMLWSAGLSAIIGLISWVLKNHVEEVKRLQILLNRTREEVARDYVTRADMHTDINRILTRIDAMDTKIDNILQRLAK
jgi:hypothetical protein